MTVFVLLHCSQGETDVRGVYYDRQRAETARSIVEYCTLHDESDDDHMHAKWVGWRNSESGAEKTDLDGCFGTTHHGNCCLIEEHEIV
jgi:hypothetical protein